MLLDEVMVNLAWKEKHPAVTAELNVRFKKAVRVGQKVVFEGRLDSIKGRLIQASAEAKGEDGEVLATATAQCMTIGKLSKSS
jgi:acyl-coenzyme A thioesterase PaaI-like protein